MKNKTNKNNNTVLSVKALSKFAGSVTRIEGVQRFDMPEGVQRFDCPQDVANY
jgi:hypothetical protein